MRLTVCELPESRDQFQNAWKALQAHIDAMESELVLLPEMPFSKWLPATKVDSAQAWEEAVSSHDRWEKKLDALTPATVLGSRPTFTDNRRLNEGFVWTADEGTSLVHQKRYLPDEPGYWEASWYEMGDAEFSPVNCGNATCGFLICTDLWAAEQARQYGRDGVDLIVNPRATEQRTTGKWRVGARSMSIISGAYLASSNRVTLSDDRTADRPFGGSGWIVDPDGTVVAETSRAQPFATVDIDLEAAAAAKSTYPRPAFNTRPQQR